MNKNLLDFELKDKTVILAGATKGVGFELAKLLVSCRAKICLIGRKKKNADEAIKQLKVIDSEAEVNFLKGDLYLSNDRLNILNEMQELYPQGVSHLVTFIGTGKTQFGVEIDIEIWRDSFEKNFFSVVDFVNTLIPLIKKTKGDKSILITSAIAGLERLDAPESYSSAKAALSSYIPHLAKSLSKEDIRVIGISPGNIFFEGGRWEQIIKEKGLEEIEEAILKNVSLNRFGTAQELAWVYLTTMSPRNSFMTGTNIIIDGQQVKKTI